MSGEFISKTRQFMVDQIKETTVAHKAQKNLSRRDFLKVAGAAVGSVVLNSCAQEAQTAILNRGIVAPLDEASAASFFEQVSVDSAANPSVIGYSILSANKNYNFVEVPPVFNPDKTVKSLQKMYFLKESGSWQELNHSFNGENNQIIWTDPTTGTSPKAVLFEPLVDTTKPQLADPQLEFYPEDGTAPIKVFLADVSNKSRVIPVHARKQLPSDQQPTATQNPTPEATATPTETPTPEVKQFPICQIENFRDCPITVDDLFNGNYLRWLNTLSKSFDQSKIKQVPMEVVFGNIITYNTKTAPNFRDPATAPFRRDVTAGYASYQGIDYIVMPVEYFDPKHPDKNQWVITVDTMYWPGHNQEKANKEIPPRAINIWRNSMKITPILNSDTDLSEGAEDPLVKMTFDNNPDMAERFGKFMSGEDMGALSKPGIVVLNDIATTNHHLYE